MGVVLLLPCAALSVIVVCVRISGWLLQEVFYLCVSELSIHQWAIQWRHNERDGVLNHRRLDCLLNHLLRCRSRKTSKLCVTGLCDGNSPLTGEFPAQRASNAENFSIWWRLHGRLCLDFRLDSSGSLLFMYQQALRQREKMLHE